MLANQQATDLCSEGNSNAIKAGQKVKTIIGAENTLIFYILRAHLIVNWAQVRYDFNMSLRIIKTALIWNTNLNLDKKRIRIKF